MLQQLGLLIPPLILALPPRLVRNIITSKWRGSRVEPPSMKAHIRSINGTSIANGLGSVLVLGRKKNHKMQSNNLSRNLSFIARKIVNSVLGLKFQLMEFILSHII